MLLGCIADDFTGASDLANTLAKNGMATVQFVGTPGKTAPKCEVGVVALKTRSIQADEAVRQSLEALRWLQSQGCTQILFKYCSTFDSTLEGNIGPVAEALLDALGAPAAIVCPAFPETGRTLYQGHLFVRDRLLNESGMEAHPLNPMTDSDIRRWLRRQTKGEVGLVGYEQVQEGEKGIRHGLEREIESGRRLIVIDALTSGDLRTIGLAVADHALVTGGSGIAVGLPDNFRRAGQLGQTGQSFTGSNGPGVVLSGSCSINSRAQIDAYLDKHPGLAIEPSDLVFGRTTVETAVAFARAHRGDAPAFYSTADPTHVADAQREFGQERIAGAIERFFGGLARKLVDDGFTRLVVGGGETAGAVVTALDLDYFVIGPEIDPGVPALATQEGHRAVCLALKSGNFGSRDFYEKALCMLEAS
jgi:3-dehydrotetronate 4-kinase